MGMDVMVVDCRRPFLRRRAASRRRAFAMVQHCAAIDACSSCTIQMRCSRRHDARHQRRVALTRSSSVLSSRRVVLRAMLFDSNIGRHLWALCDCGLPCCGTSW